MACERATTDRLLALRDGLIVDCLRWPLTSRLWHTSSRLFYFLLWTFPLLRFPLHYIPSPHLSPCLLASSPFLLLYSLSPTLSPPFPSPFPLSFSLSLLYFYASSPSHPTPCLSSSLHTPSSCLLPASPSLPQVKSRLVLSLFSLVVWKAPRHPLLGPRRDLPKATLIRSFLFLQLIFAEVLRSFFALYALCCYPLKLKYPTDIFTNTHTNILI